MSRMDEFEREISNLVNRLSLERDAGDTPDFIIAKYLRECFESFADTVAARERWYGREPKPVPGVSREGA